MVGLVLILAPFILNFSDLHHLIYILYGTFALFISLLTKHMFYFSLHKRIE
jgi:hypothetical protein